jgi:2-hydroxychromene-2-carboxylate isomerase
MISYACGVALEFYFDFISPYAYLGWRRIHDVADRHGLHVTPRPVLFAALLDAHGQRGPAEIPSKRIYTFKHVVRLAADQGTRLEPPPAHPFNPLVALRVVAMTDDPGTRRAVIDALFDATWAGGGGVGTPADVAGALDAAGLPGTAMVEAAGQPAAKARLRSTTDTAIARGVFGVPTVMVDDELFWGQDSFAHVERHLRGEDPATHEAIARWRDLPAGATRPGARR